MLCSWSIYLAAQAEVKLCGLVRRPSDDAIDEAILAIDEFILANSSKPPTRQILEDFKRRAAESQQKGAQQIGVQNYCKHDNAEFVRRSSPEEIRAAIKDLLAVPREPVMTPCL